MHALGIVAGDEIPTPDTMAYWSSYFQRETITGPVAGSTPIVTSQSPPPPPYPVYPSPSYSQPPPVPMAITMAALAIGGLLLFFVIRGVTR